MKNRRGISLVELLLALSAASVILTLSTALIYRILQAEMRARKSVNAERTCLRLARAFRRDVWQATEANPSAADQGNGVLVRLSLPPNQTIEYRRTPAGVLRVLLGQERTIAREMFAFPPAVQIYFEQDSPRAVLLSLSSTHPTSAVDSPQQPADLHFPPVGLQVRARLGVNRHFDQPTTEEDVR
jgi:hypothetical protein